MALRRLPPEVAGKPTPRAGTTAGGGAPPRHPGGATGRARASLLTGLRGGPVSGLGRGLARAPDMVMVRAAVTLTEAVTGVATGTEVATVTVTKAITSMVEYGIV